MLCSGMMSCQLMRLCAPHARQSATYATKLRGGGSPIACTAHRCMPAKVRWAAGAVAQNTLHRAVGTGSRSDGGPSRRQWAIMKTVGCATTRTRLQLPCGHCCPPAPVERLPLPEGVHCRLQRSSRSDFSRSESERSRSRRELCGGQGGREGGRHDRRCAVGSLGEGMIRGVRLGSCLELCGASGGQDWHRVGEGVDGSWPSGSVSCIVFRFRIQIRIQVLSN